MSEYKYFDFSKIDKNAEYVIVKGQRGAGFSHYMEKVRRIIFLQEAIKTYENHISLIDMKFSTIQQDITLLEYSKENCITRRDELLKELEGLQNGQKES